MSYDIHGVVSEYLERKIPHHADLLQWDGDSPYTQRVVNPHTNLTEISEGLDLLWRNKIDPSKVALGLGFYGRSFTLSDPSCNTPGCPFAGDGGGSGGGNPGKCTQVSGTLSDFEIAGILASDDPRFTYNQEAGVNWITWDSNQWVSYDDNNTLAQKEQFASGLCLSGQFGWAVDLGGPGSGQTSPSGGANNSSGSGNEPGSGDVYISPEIWSEPNPTIACYPPCTFILPPYPLASESTIPFPLYTTSLEVAWPTTSVSTGSNGQVSTITTVRRTTETTTLTIPANTQSTLDVWNWEFNNTALTKTTYQVTSSIEPIPFVITDDPNPGSSSGVSHPVQTRTITAPPYPYSDPYASTTTDTPSKTSSTTAAGVIFPSIHWTRGPPGPTCTSGCGHKCKIFCDHPCLFCPGSDGLIGFDDPSDPDPPPGPEPSPPPGGEDPDDPDEEEEDGCDPEISDEQGMLLIECSTWVIFSFSRILSPQFVPHSVFTTLHSSQPSQRNTNASTGLCDNGNFPLYDPGTGGINCDYTAEEAQSKITVCQSDAMNNPDDTQATIDQAKTCCDAPSGKRDIWNNILGLFRRASTPACTPAKQPPAPDPQPVVMPTYTCPARFPNVCANARSAIETRGRSSILTRVSKDKHYR